MKNNNFNKLFGFCGGATTASLVLAFYGCSSSNSSNPQTDASTGTDSAVQTEAGADGGSSGETGSPADTGPVSDAGEAGAVVPFDLVTQTNLVADTDAGGAPLIDPKLQNAWGLAFNPTGVAWVSENGTDLLSVYPAPAYNKLALAVAVVPPGDAGLANPTGQIFNPGAAAADGGVGDFKGDLFIACSESGTIEGWQKSDVATAVNEADESGKSAVF